MDFKTAILIANIYIALSMKNPLILDAAGIVWLGIAALILYTRQPADHGHMPD